MISIHTFNRFFLSNHIIFNASHGMLIMFNELKDYKEMQEFVKNNKSVVVSIRPKSGCEICELYAPVFKRTLDNAPKEMLNKVKIVILPIDKECIDSLNVCSPTVIFFKGGKEISRVIVETVPLEKFENVLSQNISRII